MLAIKLQRIGKKHQPSYRLVVAPARSKMAGPPVEDLGSYHPGTKAIAVKKERVAYWLSIGAQPTVTVHNLLVAQGVVTTPKRVVKMAKPVVAEAPAAAAVPKAEAVPKDETKQDEVANVEVTPDEAAPAEPAAPSEPAA